MMHYSAVAKKKATEENIKKNFYVFHFLLYDNAAGCPLKG
jgi:hypothetical protein